MSKNKKANKITMRKYVAIVEEMRKTQNFLLDISKYTPKEIELIANMVHNDTIFNYFNETKDIDIRKMKAIFEFLEAEEKMLEAKRKFV